MSAIDKSKRNGSNRKKGKNKNQTGLIYGLIQNNTCKLFYLTCHCNFYCNFYSFRLWMEKIIGFTRWVRSLSWCGVEGMSCIVNDFYISLTCFYHSWSHTHSLGWMVGKSFEILANPEMTGRGNGRFL